MKNLSHNEKSAALRRSAHRQWVLKPQDLAVGLKLMVLGDEWLPYAELGEVMCLSRYEAHAAVQRLNAAGLVAEVKGVPRIVKSALREFVVHGARYVYPAIVGGVTVGLPTAYGMSPLRGELSVPDDQVPVWPYGKGTIRGSSILPLYEKLPVAAERDVAFHELLALFDALRMGRARERALAAKYLEERIR